MTLLKCPVCEAKQDFKLKRKIIRQTNWGNLIEVYINCSHCIYRHRLRYSTNEIENLNDKILRSEQEARRQQKQNGGSSHVLQRLLERLKDELKHENDLLELMMNEHRRTLD
jgi:uncharacterized radical SAM superfamily protein